MATALSQLSFFFTYTACIHHRHEVLLLMSLLSTCRHRLRTVRASFTVSSRDEQRLSTAATEFRCKLHNAVSTQFSCQQWAELQSYHHANILCCLFKSSASITAAKNKFLLRLANAVNTSTRRYRAPVNQELWDFVIRLNRVFITRPKALPAGNPKSRWFAL
jgi:hypothetical protein